MTIISRAATDAGMKKKNGYSASGWMKLLYAVFHFALNSL
jgi:hypothetical protein